MNNVIFSNSNINYKKQLKEKIEHVEKKLSNLFEVLEYNENKMYNIGKEYNITLESYNKIKHDIIKNKNILSSFKKFKEFDDSAEKMNILGGNYNGK
jgi:predicted RNA binding protein with dsRBD fold (UPF0201 family)